MNHLPTLLKWLDVGFTMNGVGVLLVAALLWWADGWRNPLRSSPLRPNRITAVQVWLCFFVNFVGGYIGGWLARFTGAPTPPGAELNPREAILSTICGQVLVITTCLLVARRAFTAGRRGLGIGRRRFRTDLAYAVAGWLVALAVCGLLAWTTTQLIDRFFPRFVVPQHTVFKVLDDPSMPPWIRVAAIIGAFVLAPIAEELLFRGILQTALKKILPFKPRRLLHRWLAITVTSLLFGFMHLSATPQYVPALVAMGFILGYLYERQGSLLTPMLVHMMFNGKSLLWRELLG